jgi:hypothetical protein
MFDLVSLGVLRFVLGRVGIVIEFGGLEILLPDDVFPLFETLLILHF